MPGHVVECSECHHRTLEWRETLQETLATPGRLVILKGLAGHRCSNCGLQMLDLASAADVERERAGAVPANYMVALVRQRDRRGLFLTKDLARLTQADTAESVLITPLDGDHLLVELRRRARVAVHE